jgi:hypothetical protein
MILNRATSWVPVVPHATNPLPNGAATHGIYVGGAGTVVVGGQNGVDVTFTVPAGAVLPVEALYIRATSTATGMVALY